MRSVVLNGFKLVHTPAVAEHDLPERLELYELAADPGETRDLAAERPDLVATLKRRLNEWIADTSSARGTRYEVDPAALEALQGIGYMTDEDG